jgi:hypothetical protein
VLNFFLLFGIAFSSVASVANHFGTAFKMDSRCSKISGKALGGGRNRSTTLGMDEALIAAGIFMLGAGSGAALSYLNDRRMLRLYGSLVRQLSTALRQQLHPVRTAAAKESVLPHLIVR